jgi:hypothetical protein
MVKRKQLFSKFTLCNCVMLSCQLRGVNGSLAMDWEGDGSSGGSLPYSTMLMLTRTECKKPHNNTSPVKQSRVEITSKGRLGCLVATSPMWLDSHVIIPPVQLGSILAQTPDQV